jgi:hypothetical protein
MTWNSAAGVGGASGVVQATASNTDQTLVYNTGFDWTLSSSFSTSIFFQYRGVDAGATRQYAQLGFLESNSISFNSGAGQDYVSVRVQNSGGSQLQILGQSANNGGTTNVGLSFNISGNVTANNWYRLSGTFSKLGSNTIGFSTDLIDFGANGTTQGATIASTSGNFTIAAGFYSDTAVFNGVRSTVNSSQGYLDNYTVVPEPAAWALLAASGTVVIFMRRNRRRVE